MAMNEGHFKDLLFELIPPPAQRALSRAAGAGATNPAADLMMMGFPTRLPDASPPSLCVCHSELHSEGFLCPRCLAKVCDVPTDCDICDLMVVSSPHLARSYHHLFPVKPYTAVSVFYLFLQRCVLILFQNEHGRRVGLERMSRMCPGLPYSLWWGERRHESCWTLPMSGVFGGILLRL